jgi:hypothetical protein
VNRTSHPAAQVLLLASALCLAGVAAAGLKDKPPEGLKLSGTEWQIDPYHSDDPVAAIDNAERALQERKQREREDAMGRRMPGPAGVDSAGRCLPDPAGNCLPDAPGRNGGWDRSPGRPSTNVDPWGTGTQSGGIQYGSLGGRNQFMDQLNRNPQELAFRQVEEHVTITEDGIDTDCTAGEKNPVADSFGDGERRCGWSGRAWVVETKRGKGFTRTDRYELSKNGQTLRYETTASGSGLPNVTITRMYEVARHPN